MSKEGGDAASTSETFLLNQPIVMDNGTGSVKAGFAGGSKPKVTIGNKIGVAKHLRIMPGGALESDGGRFVGRKVEEHRGAFRLEHPMERGSVVDWEGMERIWEHLYSEENLAAKTDEHPVLLTEAPLNPSRNRERTAEIFFETFRSPATFFAPPAVLSLYASGRTTGVVLDAGEGLTHAVPVYEGFALPHSISRSDLGGRDVTDRFALLLRRGGLPVSTTAEVDLARRIKEAACYVALRPDKERVKPTEYQLPDGRPVTLEEERFRAPEVLFCPRLVGSEEAGAADLLLDSIMKSDLDLRATLFDQVVLAGGSTLFPGFGDRFLHELRQRAPQHTRIRISAPPDRIHSTWVGGSILASLATFKSMWVSRSDYEEHGVNIIHSLRL